MSLSFKKKRKKHTDIHRLNYIQKIENVLSISYIHNKHDIEYGLLYHGINNK